MLQQPISWTDETGQTITRNYYFNFTKAELLELELSVDGGLAKRIEALGATPEPRDAYRIIKGIVLDAYGERVTEDDGKVRFVKSARAREDFASSEAFSSLVMSFFEDADKAAKFMDSLVPADMREQVKPKPQDHLPPAQTPPTFQPGVTLS